jgi:hypothetical protein
MMDDETVFQSSGSGPALAYSATGGMFGGEDAELNRAIEESLRSNAGATSSGIKPATKIQPPQAPFPGFDCAEAEDPELAAAIAASLEMGQGGPSHSIVHADEDDPDFWKDQNSDLEAEMEDQEEKTPPPPRLQKDHSARAQTVEEDEEVDEDEEEEEKPPTAAELRAKRLARFG